MSAPSEPPAVLFAEAANILATTLMAWTNGVLFSITVLCIRTLLITKRSPLAHRWFHIGYVCILFALGTCGAVLNVVTTVKAFVYNRDFPGGPMAYMTVHYSSPLSISSFSVFVIATWLQDGYLLYRFMTIYRFKSYICAIPTLMYLASIGCSCILLAQLSKPGENIWKDAAINFATPYWILSIALNVSLTVLIVVRILWARRQNRRIPGGQNDRVYVTIATLLIESAALYSIVGIIYLILYLTGNTVQELLLAILGEVQCIAPMLIIYRVAKGAEWSPHNARRLPFDTTGPYTLSTVQTTQLAALGNDSVLTDTTSSGGGELVGEKQMVSCPEHPHIV